MERNQFIDLIKGLLIILVVWGHAIQFIAYRGADCSGDPIFKFIYMFHMPLFMAISGYLSFKSINKTPPIVLVVKKLSNYIVPALFSTLIYFIIFQIPTGGAGLIIRKLAHAERTSLNNLWFLWTLFGITTICSFLNKISLSPLAAIVAFLVLLAIPETGIMFFIKFLFPFFLIGYFLAEREFFTSKAGGGRKIFKKTLLAAISIISVACYLMWNGNTYIYGTKMDINLTNIWNIVLRYISGISVSVLFLVFTSKTDQIYCGSHFWQKMKNLLASIGKASLGIYILQSFAFSLLETHPIGSPFGNTLHRPHHVVAVFMAVLVTILTFVLTKIVGSNRWTSRLLLGR